MANNDRFDKSNLEAAFFALTLDRNARAPLHRQLAEELRALILSGRAMPGARLPASRDLARELSVSRVTTVTAYDQLAAEGYLETRRGAGTFVARDLPHLAPPVPPGAAAGPEPAGSTAYVPFHPGIPDLSAFPHREWARHLDRAWRDPDPALLARPDPLGWPPLRAAIAAHLRAWRGLDCTAGQVVITSGAAEAFGLIGRALLGASDGVYVEEPGYGPMRSALEGAGRKVMPSQVDGDGFDIGRASLLGPARAAVVTPSRHYPLGMTMPLSRRLALLEWASRTGGIVVEDDYDSEFRYRGQPLPALVSLDQGGRVIYVGSFSKLLSPSLRLGYLVVPTGLLPEISAQVARRGGARASLVPQPALAAFMESGEFAVHLRRMRRLYAARQEALRAAIAEQLPDHVVAPADPGGMHLVCPLGPALAGRVRDTDVAAAGRAQGLTLRALSAYSTVAGGAEGLALGYAAFAEDALRDGVTRLARAVRGL